MTFLDVFNNIFGLIGTVAIAVSFVKYIRKEPSREKMIGPAISAVAVIVIIAGISAFISSSRFIHSLQSLQFYEVGLILVLLVTVGVILIRGPLRRPIEVIYTEQDVTIEREVSNTTAPSISPYALYARTIRVTRYVSNIRTGKVLDMEVEEYDVFRDSSGKEIRRLRLPQI